MKLTNIIITISLVLLTCNSIAQTKSQSKNVIQRKTTNPKAAISKMVLVSAGQASPCETLTFQGSDFDLVAKGTDTIYLSTNDSRFQTPEGYKIGTKLSELPTNIQNTLAKETGWGYYFKIPSGWSLGFCEGSSCTDSYPKPGSIVRWIFKRK